jgi:zinc resistance-associated protein
MNTNKKIVGVIAVVFTVVTAGIVFAHGGFDGPMRDYGPGYGGYRMGPGMMGYGGYGGHMMGYGPWSDRGYGRNLSDAKVAKLDAAREQFFNDTRELRNQIADKQFDLRRELNIDNPDATKVTQLQKELSKLESEFDQKNIQYELEVRKILPEDAVRSGYGYGFRNRGYCW